jgi:hypothetical protein
MEAKLYARLYQMVFAMPHSPRRAREQFCDRWVTMVYLWSVLHDRAMSWACDVRNWPGDLLDRPLISQSRLSRRLRTVGVTQLIERLLSGASDLFGTPPPLVKALDSKPLTVGAYSKDPDAAKGRLADGVFGKGYRLHAIMHGRNVRHWTLLPLNQHDSIGAAKLLPRLEGGGYLLADNAYDSNDCHAAAAQANHQLVAPPRACNKDVRDVKHNLPQRLRALDMLHSPLPRAAQTGFGPALYNTRQRIESGFGGLTFSGLGALPPWVRRPRRVALWTAGKLLIFLCRNALNKGLIA